MKLNKGRRSDYRIKLRAGFEVGSVISLMPTVVWPAWRFRAIGDPAFVFTWLGVTLWFGEWDKK